MLTASVSLWRAGPFSPRQIPNLEVWLDGADRTSLRQISDGSVPVGASGDPVGYWADKSGLGRHVVQATGTRRASFVEGAMHGRSAVRFDGVDDVLTRAGFAYPSAFTALAVSLVRGGLGVDQCLWGNNVGGSRVAAMTLATGTNQVVQVVSPDLSIQTSDAQPYTGWSSRLVAVSRQASGFGQVWVNGVSNGASSTSYSGATQNLNVGARDSAGSSPFNGDLGELLLFGRSLSLGEINALQAYLAHKWGVGAQEAA